MKITKIIFFSTILLFESISLANVSECTTLNDGTVVLEKSGGYWEQDNRYGNYRVVVRASGTEHVHHIIELQTIHLLNHDSSENIVRCEILQDSGTGGNVIKNVEIEQIDVQGSPKTIVTLDTYLRAIEPLTRRDVFWIAPNKKATKIMTTDVLIKSFY